MATANKKPVKGKNEERPIVYAEESVEMCKGDNAITLERAKEMIGWEKTDLTDKDLYLLVDNPGNRIICKNNDRNRRFDEKWSRSLGQDMLNKHYKFNGESIIFSDRNTCVSGQHRLIGFILACQEWAGESNEADAQAKSDHWKTIWEEEPVLESVVVWGVKVDEAVRQTYDCTKPRTIADACYTTGTLEGASISKTKETTLSKMLEYATRLTWDRTGAKEHAFSPYRTTPEVMEFIARHKRLPLAVKSIYQDWSGIIEGKEMDKDKKKVRAPDYMLPFGTAAGMLYLMGASLTDGDAYRAMEQTSEKGIDFKAKCAKHPMSKADEVWDRACEFWIAMRNKQHPLTKTIETVEGNLLSPTKDFLSAGTLTVREKMIVIIKAWLNFRDGGPITLVSLKPEYKPDPDNPGRGILSDFPVIGGIDCGGAPPEGDDVSTESNVRSTEEVEAEKEAIRQEARDKADKDAKASGKAPVKPAAKPASKATDGELELSEEDRQRIEQNRNGKDKKSPAKAPKAGQAEAKDPTPASKAGGIQPPKLKGGIGK